jgi:hypothetical protein
MTNTPPLGVISDPLDHRLLVAVNGLLDRYYDVLRGDQNLAQGEDLNSLESYVRRVGSRLLGSFARFKAVELALCDGPYRGDVCWALLELADSGEVELSPSVRDQCQRLCKSWAS